MPSFDDLIKKFGMGRSVDQSEKAGFFDKMRKMVSLEHLKTLWHIAMHTSCASKVFSTYEIALLVAAVAYVVCPIDAVPDYIPMAGLLDDAAVLAWVIDTYGDKLEEYKQTCM